MIVEFIGTTGAGKTTLIKEVKRRLSKSAQVTTSFDLIATPLGLGGVTHPTARNLIQELIGFPFFLQSLPRHRAYVDLYLRLLARQEKFTFFMMNNLRSLERKLGVFEMINRKDFDQIILVDEGTVLSAHHVFVFTNVSYTTEEISRFASVLPLPDVIVYIRVPMEMLLERSLKRADPPRMMRSRNRVRNEIYIRRAVTMFEQLVKTEQIQNRALIVENPNYSQQEWDKTVHQITDFIINYDPATNESKNKYLTTQKRSNN